MGVGATVRGTCDMCHSPLDVLGHHQGVWLGPVSQLLFMDRANATATVTATITMAVVCV